MDLPKLPIDRRWIEQELKPYLRCAFSYALPCEADIAPQVWNAIEFCMRKPDYATDGDDLIFERICLAIDRRDKDFAPDLSIVTQCLESLAKFLIRRAQLKGPYELLGRMNVGSGAWREYEANRLEDRKVTAENEKKTQPAIAPSAAPRPAPTEDQIDPRLVNALPGQYASPNLSGMLAVAEDQYFRHQNRLLNEYHQHQNRATAPSLQQQLQQTAAEPNVQKQHSFQMSGKGWRYGQPSVYSSPPKQAQALSYMQDLGQRQGALQFQAYAGGAREFGVVHGGINSSLRAAQAPYQPFTTEESTHPTAAPSAALPLRPMPTFAPQQFISGQQQLQHLPVLQKPTVGPPHTTPMHQLPVTSTSCMAPATNATLLALSNVQSAATIPTADLAHLRGKEWSEAVEQRVREFKLLTKREKAENILRLYQIHPLPDAQARMLSPEHSNMSAGPQSAFSGAVLANMTERNSFQPTPQQSLQQRAHQQAHRLPQIQVDVNTVHQGFANHPGFSNIRSTFPTSQYGEASPQQAAQNKDVRMMGLPFNTGPSWN